MLSVNLASLDTCQLCELIFHNTSNICLHMDVIVLVTWAAWIKSYQFAWGGFLVLTSLIGMAWRVWFSFVLATTPHTSCNNVWRMYILSHQITCAIAWMNVIRFSMVSNKSFCVIMSSELKLVHGCKFIPWDVAHANNLNLGAYIMVGHDL
jgi:hypothetical protein